MTVRHASGDDVDGCVQCWTDADAEQVWGEPENRTCREPSDDGEGWCGNCGHEVELVPSMALPMTGECE